MSVRGAYIWEERGRGVTWRDGRPNVQIAPINRTGGCSYINVCPAEDSGAAGEQGRVRSPDEIMQHSPAVYKNLTWEGTRASRGCPHLGDQVCTPPRSCVAAALTRTFLSVYLDFFAFIFVNYLIGEIFDGILEHFGTYVELECQYGCQMCPSRPSAFLLTLVFGGFSLLLSPLLFL